MKNVFVLGCAIGFGITTAFLICLSIAFMLEHDKVLKESEFYQESLKECYDLVRLNLQDSYK